MKKLIILLVLTLNIIAYGESVIHEKDGNVGIGTPDPMAKVDVVNYANYIGDGATKHYLIDYKIAKATVDPTDIYLLLHKAEMPGDSLNDHYIFGTITAVRGNGGKKDSSGKWVGGQWNRKAVVYVDTASAYRKLVDGREHNRLYVKSIYEDWNPVFVTYKGIRYVALKVPYPSTTKWRFSASALFALEFTGWAYVADGEMLKIVRAKEVNDITSFTPRETVTEYANKKINGSLTAKEVLITPNGWADDVFNKNYKMMNLCDLDKYITKNKHLPGIESGKNIEKKGISVGNMQEKMMRKIEELTKYIIEQNKKMEEMQKKIKYIERN